jgi:DNA-binding LacI/PurR family transcriptional regulator
VTTVAAELAKLCGAATILRRATKATGQQLGGVVALGAGTGVRALSSVHHARRAVPDQVAVVAFEDAAWLSSCVRH